MKLKTMGILFLITFIFLRIENSNAENSLPVTLKNSGIIKINSNNNESITTIMPKPIMTNTTTINNGSIINSDDVIMENKNLENLNIVTMSAALVRARREPPITIIKHRSRPFNRRPKQQRRRIKKPKIRYGPPNYNFGEPLSYYKQPSSGVGETFESAGVNPYKIENNEEIYDIQSFNKEFGTDFKTQSFELSDYEKQPIEVNFYGRRGSGRSGSSRKRKPSYWSTEPDEHNYQKPDDQFWKQFAESPSIIPPKPTNAYGIPAEYNYQSTENNYPSPPQNNYPPPPQESYQLPAHDIYQSFSEDTYNPSIQNTYKPQPQQPPHTYQSLPHENYKPEKHIFAEPSPANIQWNYQSSYDNNPSTEYTSPQLPQQHSTESNTGNFIGPKYLPPSANDVKNFNEPKNNNGYFAEPPTHYNKYTVPDSDLTLPLDESHKSPSYDYPKSSYEVPIYNSIPFNSNDATPVQHIIYPPNDLYRPDYSAPTQTISKESSNKIEIKDILNLTPHNNKNINVSTFSTSLEELLDPPFDYTANISKNTNRRKRKRTREPTNNKKQHILDTDELRQAFGSNLKIDQKYKPDEQQFRSSTKKRTPENFVLVSSVNDEINSGESSVSQNWEPIKLRENNNSNNHQNIKINENNNSNISNNKKITNDRQIRFERTTEESFKDIQVISIEKSHSHSFYAGTMSPYELIQKYPGVNSREDNGAVYVSSHINVGVEENSNNNNEKRKGQVFDEKLRYRNLSGDELPKNHKYF